MKKIKKIVKKILLIALVSLEIILINIQPVHAGLGSLLGGILGSKGSASPNANGMLDQMEERYHLSPDSIKDFGESFNVSNQKSPAPEVDIFFNPTNPKLGEKVTATAIPKYFQEGVENMYFSWYLKRDGCEDGLEEGEPGWKDSCDVNDDRKIDTNDWKVEAMRLIAGNGFITEKADYSSDNDNDGYRAHRGGRVNIQEIDYCYVHDFSSGKDYEIATADSSDNDDENGFDCKNDDGTAGTVMCTSPYTRSCGVLDGALSVPSQDLGGGTAAGGTGGDGGDTETGGTGGTGGTVDLDIAVPAHEEPFEGITIESMEAQTDSGYEPSCDLETKKISCPEGTVGRCIKDEDLDLIDPKCASAESEGGGTANFNLTDITINGTTHPFYMRCYDDGRLFTRVQGQGMDYCGNGGEMDSPPGGECTVTLNTSAGVQTWTFTNPGGPEPECSAAEKGCPGRYEDGSGFLWKSVGGTTGLLAIFFPAEFAEGCSISNPGEQDVNCTSTLFKSEDVDLVCNHQFPKIAGMAVGDGSFDLEEEKFWGTDPNNPSTAGNGNTDEANVAGLGQDKLTWTYLPGDKVGVIIEGQSYMGTKHDDSSNAISFALVNNIFHKDGDVSSKGNPLCQMIEQEKYVEEIKGYDVEIPFAKVDISDCLKYNLIAPTDGFQADNMEITLDYSPKNPNVGAKGVDGAGQSMGGDTLVVSSNTEDPNLDTSQIYYKWSIYGFAGERTSLELDKSAWTNLSANAEFRSDNNIKMLEGLGMDQFELQLNDIGNYNFLMFSTESEEYFDTGTGTTGTTRSGRGDVIVEPNKSNAQSGINIKVGSTAICTTGTDCEVLDNQVITTTLESNNSVSNYLWTLDGKEITTLNGATKQGNSVSFILEGNPGDYHTLNVVANDTASPGSGGGNTGQKLNITRNFVVTKPMVGIGPNNKINRGDVMDTTTGKTVCKDLNGNVDESAVLGTYTTLNPTATNKTANDCKENVFNGSGIVTLTPTYYPDWISGSLKNVKYYVNGVAQDNGTVDLSGYPVGSLVNISYEAEYWQPDQERTALLDWGISEGESSGKKISDSITVKVGEPASQPIAKKASKIIAGLAYNIPEQMIFMFRMMLTAVIIIFASGIVLSLGKRKYN